MVKVSLLFLDSNVWIFAELEEYPEHEVAAKRVEAALKENEIGINSIIDLLHNY